MVTRRTFIGGLVGATIAPSFATAAADRDIEPEFLRDWLRAGRIPAMVERLPTHPRIINMKEWACSPVSTAAPCARSSAAPKTSAT
jgi:peptide/nickel transport system substrate-binding protein